MNQETNSEIEGQRKAIAKKLLEVDAPRFQPHVASDIINNAVEPNLPVPKEDTVSVSLEISTVLHKIYDSTALKQNLVKEYNKANRRFLQLRYFMKLRLITTESHLEREVKELGVTLLSNRDLWQRLSVAMVHEQTTRTKLEVASRTLSIKDHDIARSMEEAERQWELKVQLMQWRFAKSNRERSLEQKMKNYRRSGVHSVEKKLQMLETLNEEVRRLTKQQLGVQKATTFVEEQYAHELREHQEDHTEICQYKEHLLEKLASFRNNIQHRGPPQVNPLLELWKQRYKTLRVAKDSKNIKSALQVTQTEEDTAKPRSRFDSAFVSEEQAEFSR